MLASKNDGDIVAGIKISLAQRIIDKQSGVSKIDLARYYEAVAPWMLAYPQTGPWP